LITLVVIIDFRSQNQHFLRSYDFFKLAWLRECILNGMRDETFKNLQSGASLIFGAKEPQYKNDNIAKAIDDRAILMS